MKQRLITLIACLWATPVAADVFLLRDGGRIVGKWLNRDQNPITHYRIRAKFGGVISLAKSQVRDVRETSPKLIEYERLRAKAAATVAGHWELAEWCKAQNLLKQRSHHLTQVLALDPDHKQARYALGFSRVGGVWSREEERMTRRGLVRFQRGWRTRQEVRVLTAKQSREDKANEWKKKVRTWRSWIRGGRRRRSEGYANFAKLRDPTAIGALAKLLNSKKEPPGLKLIYLDAIERMPDKTATNTLIRRILEDPNEDVRDRSIAILKRYKSHSAVDTLIAKLKDKSNRKVNRAAKALGELKDPRAMPFLIRALTTKHDIIVPTRQAGNIGATFGNGVGGLNLGGGDTRVITRELKNEQVYQALMALNPGVNYVFDKIRWRRWYVLKNTPGNINLRRDK